MPIDSQKAQAWLQLVRLPNLVTVPGDSLSGMMLAFSVGVRGNIVAALFIPVVSLLLYMAGLIMNDYADIEEDRRERPTRPLPAGLISLNEALAVAVGMIFSGCAIAFLINTITGITAILLTVTILLYDFILKKDAFIGSLIMGLCRALSFLLGAFAVGFKIGIHSFIIIQAALMFLFYIAAVTNIAANETDGIYIGNKRWVPVGVVIMLLVVLRPFSDGVHWILLAPGLVAVGMAFNLACQLADMPEPETVQKSIGKYIRIMLLLQAAVCFVFFPYGIIIGLLLIALLPFGNKLAKKFYAS